MKDHIRDLLGRGIPAVNVALAVGCDESYISQLMSDEVFAAEVSALKVANFEKFAAADEAADSAEEMALTRMKQLIPFITKPGEAARVYQVLNAAKRRTQAGAAAAQAAPSTIVNIALPVAARVAMLVDHNKQVIEVDGRPLVTMPARELVKRTEAAQAERLLTASVPKTLKFGTSELPVTQLSERL